MDIGDLSKGKLHFDSHADTCAGGSSFVMLDSPDQIQNHVDISPFSEEYEPIKDIPVASCATSYTDLKKWEKYILVFHQILYFDIKNITQLALSKSNQGPGECGRQLSKTIQCKTEPWFDFVI